MGEETPAGKSNGGRRQRRVRLTNWQIILIALIVVGGRLVIDFSQRIIEGQQKLSEQRELEAQIADLLAEQRELESDKRYYSSTAYVEAWAHDEGKMVRDGEVLVLPLYERVQPAAPAVAADEGDADQPLPAWQIWWTLFFDGDPPQATAALP